MRILVVPVLSVLAALALGYALLPREQELAFMQLRAGQLAEAKAHYESRLDMGDLSVSTVNSLVEVYTAVGDMDHAVILMEDYVHGGPESLDVRRRLGRLYREARRPGDYQRNLEALFLLAPSEEVLRELAEDYAFNDQFDQLLEVRKFLVERHGGTAAERIDLARLLATDHRREEAAVVLLRGSLHDAAVLGEEARALLLSLLLDLGRGEEALEHALSWLGDGVPPARVVEYVDRFVDHDRASEARRIIERTVARPDAPEVLCITHAKFLLDIDERASARRVLETLLVAGDVSAGGLAAFIDVALSVGAEDLAFAQVVALGADLVPARLMPGLVNAAREAGRDELAERLLGRLPADRLAATPLVAARIAYQEGDLEEARRWLERSASRDSRFAPDIIERANLHLAVGQRDEAVALFDALILSPGMPEDCFPGLAELFISSGRAEAGYAFFDELRASRPLIPVVTGWASLAVAAGRVDELSAWIDRQSRLGVDLLLAVSESAEKGGATQLAVACAERLYARQVQPRTRLRLAEALLAAGRAAEALAHAREMEPSGGSAVADLYMRALVAAGETGELGDYLEREIHAGNLGTQREDAYLYALLDLGQGVRALPQLYVRARDRAGPWLFAYVESVAGPMHEADCVAFLGHELGRNDLDAAALQERFVLLYQRTPETAVATARPLAYADPVAWGAVYFDALARLEEGRAGLLEFCRYRLDRDDTPPRDRRAMAYQLLEAGETATATVTFMELAREAGPASNDLRQLLYIWGPRPGQGAVAWLAARARAAPSAERAAWLGHLLEHGAANEMVALVESGAADGPGVDPVYAQALDRLRDRDGLALLLPRVVSVCEDTLQLRRYAQVAVTHRLNDDARRAWGRLLERRPHDREALLWLGGDALRDRRWGDAEALLRLGAAHHPGDHDLTYALAEALSELQRKEEAKVHYETTLQLLGRISRKTAAMSLTKANALARLGRADEAQASFELLLAKRPGDREARADYATLLLDIGLHERAREVLELETGR